jgi:hypothetical protein
MYAYLRTRWDRQDQILGFGFRLKKGQPDEFYKRGSRKYIFTAALIPKHVLIDRMIFLGSQGLTVNLNPKDARC